MTPQELLLAVKRMERFVNQLKRVAGEISDLNDFIGSAQSHKPDNVQIKLTYEFNNNPYVTTVLVPLSLAGNIANLLKTKLTERKDNLTAVLERVSVVVDDSVVS